MGVKTLALNPPVVLSPQSDFRVLLSRPSYRAGYGGCLGGMTRRSVRIRLPISVAGCLPGINLSADRIRDLGNGTRRRVG